MSLDMGWRSYLPTYGHRATLSQHDNMDLHGHGSMPKIVTELGLWTPPATILFMFRMLDRVTGFFSSPYGCSNPFVLSNSGRTWIYDPSRSQKSLSLQTVSDLRRRLAGMTAGDLAQGLLKTYRSGFGDRDMETQMYQTVAYIVAKSFRWWFGTCFIFHNIWDNPSQLTFIFFRGVAQPPTSNARALARITRVFSSFFM